MYQFFLITLHTFAWIGFIMSCHNIHKRTHFSNRQLGHVFVPVKLGLVMQAIAEWDECIKFRTSSPGPQLTWLPSLSGSSHRSYENGFSLPRLPACLFRVVSGVFNVFVAWWKRLELQFPMPRITSKLKKIVAHYMPLDGMSSENDYLPSILNPVLN